MTVASASHPGLPVSVSHGFPTSHTNKHRWLKCSLYLERRVLRHKETPAMKRPDGWMPDDLQGGAGCG